MVENITSALIITILFVLAFPILYLMVGISLERDIELISGKKAARRRWKDKDKNFIQKFFYIGYIYKIKRWHYGAFILFLIGYIVMTVCINIWVFSPTTIIRQIVKVSGGICSLSVIILSRLFFLSRDRLCQKGSKAKGR